MLLELLEVLLNLEHLLFHQLPVHPEHPEVLLTLEHLSHLELLMHLELLVVL